MIHPVMIDAYKLIHTGVVITLQDYAVLPAVQRTFIMIIKSVEDKKKLL